MLLAIIFLVLWSFYCARRAGYNEDFVLGAAIWAVPLGVVGAKLVHTRYIWLSIRWAAS